MENEKTESKFELTKEEQKRIEETRKFDALTPGTIAYRLALENDTLVVGKTKAELEIRKTLFMVQKAKNEIRRLEVQLASGNITEEFEPGKLMTHDEVDNLIYQKKFLRDAWILDLPKHLMQLRAYVGYKDVAKNIILSEEEFETSCNQVEEFLNGLGKSMYSHTKEYKLTE